MTHSWKQLRRALLIAIAAIAPVQLGHAQQDSDTVLLDRQLSMQQLDTDFGTLTKIIAGELKPDKLHETALSVARDAREAADSFKSRIQGGGSKPALWTNWDDFGKRMDDFIARSDALAKATETQSGGALFGPMGEVAGKCEECHFLYRIKQDQ